MTWRIDIDSVEQIHLYGNLLWYQGHEPVGYLSVENRRYTCRRTDTIIQVLIVCTVLNIVSINAHSRPEAIDLSRLIIINRSLLIGNNGLDSDINTPAQDIHYTSLIIWYGTNNTESNTTGTARTISKTNAKANTFPADKNSRPSSVHAFRITTSRSANPYTSIGAIQQHM